MMRAASVAAKEVDSAQKRLAAMKMATNTSSAVRRLSRAVSTVMMGPPITTPIA
jgi:hypothetical protein